jgi:hypothetical protein
MTKFGTKVNSNIKKKDRSSDTGLVSFRFKTPKNAIPETIWIVINNASPPAYCKEEDGILVGKRMYGYFDSERDEWFVSTLFPLEGYHKVIVTYDTIDGETINLKVKKRQVK